jgi:hypothetical protein
MNWPGPKLFAVGLSVRLVGAGLIWLRDGRASLVRKGLVVVGVLLSIGGIAVLKFLLYRGPRRKPRAAATPPLS